MTKTFSLVLFVCLVLQFAAPGYATQKRRAHPVPLNAAMFTALNGTRRVMAEVPRFGGVGGTRTEYGSRNLATR